MTVAAAGDRASVESFLKGDGIFGCAVAGGAEIFDVVGCGGSGQRCRGDT